MKKGGKVARLQSGRARSFCVLILYFATLQLCYSSCLISVPPNQCLKNSQFQLLILCLTALPIPNR